MIPLKRMGDGLAVVAEVSGRAIAWLVLGMTLLVGYDVAMRYLFQGGSIGLQELEWHLFAVIFLLGAAYTYRHDAHVRVELLYQRFSVRGRAIANLIGDIFFLLPFCVLIIVSAWPFVYNAWQFAEASPDPGGLTHRYLIKAAIPVGFGLLLVQGLANIFQNLVRLAKR